MSWANLPHSLQQICATVCGESSYTFLHVQQMKTNGFLTELFGRRTGQMWNSMGFQWFAHIWINPCSCIFQEQIAAILLPNWLHSNRPCNQVRKQIDNRPYWDVCQTFRTVLLCLHLVHFDAAHRNKPPLLPPPPIESGFYPHFHLPLLCHCHQQIYRISGKRQNLWHDFPLSDIHFGHL